MLVSKVITAIVLSTAVSVGVSHAQALPSEFPPSSFTGKQFIDSSGCTFIRTGSSANVTWYPRINPKRKHICGQQPTFASTPARAPAPVRVAEAPPVRVAKPVSTSAAAPRRVVRAPVTTVAMTVAAPRVAPRAPMVAPPATPRRVVMAPPSVSPSPTFQRPAQSTTTPCASGTSQYTSGGKTFAVRCGPQALSPTGGQVMAGTISSPVSYVRTTNAVQAAPMTIAGTPRTIRYVKRMPTKITPPAGYVNAWTDGRLNPNRGIGTLSGRAQMDLIWTQTVPRKLIDQRRGIEVTQYYPTVQYPVIPNYGYAVPATTTRPAVTRARITPKAATTPRTSSAASHRFVQVATFAGQKGASQAIARLQRQGISARIRSVKRGNQNVAIVLAGPFSSQSQLKRALSAARRAGYSSAALLR